MLLMLTTGPGSLPKAIKYLEKKNLSRLKHVKPQPWCQPFPTKSCPPTSYPFGISTITHSVCFAMSFRIAGGLAPVKVSTFSPSWKNRIVGMARMPSSWVSSGSSSTSNLANTALSWYSSASDHLFF